MKNILEQAIVHLLNEENDKANELFHRFMVERARQIHESLRQGEPEACSEEYFTESDLDGIEGDADADMVPAGEDNAEFGASEADAAGDDAAADDLSGDDVDGDNTFGDDAAADDMGGEEETLDDIKASIDELIAKFDEMMGTGDDSDEAAGDDESYGDDDAADDFGGSDDEADDAEDDFTAADDETSEDEMHESEGDDEEGEGEDDDFDAITESIIAELEKVNVASGDDKEIGTGKTIGANKSSTLPTSTPEPGDAKPVKINSKNHVGFERETAPASKSLPKGKNTRNRSTDGTEKVSKEGDKSSALNKDFAGSAGNDKSPLAKKGNPF